MFQKRSANKKIAPGRFDVSVGGHYAAGENAVDAGPREIKEELGLDVDFKELIPLGRRIFVYCFTSEVKEYEFQDVFLLPRSVFPVDIALQQEEVDGLLKIDVADGIRLLSGEAANIETRFLDRDNKESNIILTGDQFVPCLDSYYLKLLVIAQRYFHGERNLLLI